MAATESNTAACVTARVSAITTDTIELAVPHTDYRIVLNLPDGATVSTPVGKRIRGVVHVEALRIHPATGGGRFIEPVWGAPRIVAGTILEADASQGRILVDVAIPMWATVPEGQDWSVLATGRLINMYVESGARFEPASD